MLGMEIFEMFAMLPRLDVMEEEVEALLVEALEDEVDKLKRPIIFQRVEITQIE